MDGPYTRFSVPVDLCVTLPGGEEAARELLKEALLHICDGVDMPNLFAGFEVAEGMEDVRIYGFKEEADEAEVIDSEEE